MKSWLWFPSLAGLLGVASVVESRLAVFALLLLVIAFAQLTRARHEYRQRVAMALGFALACAVIGLGRFTLQEAMPGIIEAHGRASGGRAVSFLRELSFAEDALRKSGAIDPDRDGIGGAGRLGELVGGPSERAPSGVAVPPLAPRYAPRTMTNSGPASEEAGYLYIVCVPQLGGGFTARPSAAVDEERAERRFLAYAWPLDRRQATASAYVIDQHENILETDNSGADGYRLLGTERAPACDDVETAAASYRPWKGKKPRTELPGDHPAAPRP